MTTDIKVPRKQQAGWVTKALATAPKDGTWHLIKTMALSSAEQTARSLNPIGSASGWQFGYRLMSNGSDFASELWVRWV